MTIEEDPPVFHSPPPQHGGHSPHFATPPPEFSGSAGADPRRRAGGGHPRHAGVSPSCLHPSLSSGGFILLPMLCALNIFKSISEEDISLLSTSSCCFWNFFFCKWSRSSWWVRQLRRGRIRQFVFRSRTSQFTMWLVKVLTMLLLLFQRKFCSCQYQDFSKCRFRSTYSETFNYSAMI